MTLRGTWQPIVNGLSRQYRCGHCGAGVASVNGVHATGAPPTPSAITATIRICPNCNRPSYFEGNDQLPGVMIGADVLHVPAEVGGLYNEARRCTASGAPTAAVLATRKLLMHIAVNKGAAEGESFLAYVDYLASKGYVPPDGKGWVDHIRTRGNEANHEIRLMNGSDAEELLTFAEMLLKFIYEFPRRVPKSAAPASAAS